MEDRVRRELSDYRMKRAWETLADAEKLLEAGSAESSANRSYYAIFHALRAIAAYLSAGRP